MRKLWCCLSFLTITVPVYWFVDTCRAVKWNSKKILCLNSACLCVFVSACMGCLLLLSFVVQKHDCWEIEACVTCMFVCAVFVLPCDGVMICPDWTNWALDVDTSPLCSCKLWDGIEKSWLLTCIHTNIVWITFNH